MKPFTSLTKKTLLYNLILFDFILLKSSANKFSNFFIKCLHLKKSSLIKKTFLLPVRDLVKSFKRFIRLFYFIKKIKYKFYSINVLGNSDSMIELLQIIFKQFKFNYPLLLTSNPTFNSHKRALKNILFLDLFITKTKIFSLFLKNFYFLTAVNNFIDNIYINFYKIFSDLEDYKKLIFISLILVSIFKK